MPKTANGRRSGAPPIGKNPPSLRLVGESKAAQYESDLGGHLGGQLRSVGRPHGVGLASLARECVFTTTEAA